MSSQAKPALLQATTETDTHPESEMDPKTARAAKRIKIMRVVQSTLSALLSLGIAIFQARVYATYQNTRSQEGMWPTVPNVMPTLLLFSVAIVALVFDGCSKSPSRPHSQLLAGATGSTLRVATAPQCLPGAASICPNLPLTPRVWQCSSGTCGLRLNSRTGP